MLPVQHSRELDQPAEGIGYALLDRIDLELWDELIESWKAG